MTKVVRACVLVLSCLIVWGVAAPAARAQSAGALTGRITDPTGGALGGVRVEAVGPSRKAATTDESGAFRITGLDPGRYSVVVRKARFAPLVRDEVVVTAGQVTSLDAELALAPLEEQVNVQEEQALSLDERDSAGALVLTEKDLEALPDDPDELAEALQALAGPAAGPNGGQLFVDGFSGASLPPKSSIREIRINSNPFSAEFDRLGFGRIEILTKPGADTLRGDATFGFNDESLNSRNPYAPNRPAFQRREWEMDLGGPLVANKASFFLDVERRDVDDNDLINATVLNPGLIAEPFSLAVLTPQRRTELSPRLDIQLGTRHTLTMRYRYEDSARPMSGIGEYSLLSRAYESSSRQHMFQLSETAVISKTVANETRVMWRRDRNEQDGDNSIPTLQVLDAFTGGGAQVGRSYNQQQRLEIQNITSWVHGRHTLRAGVRVRGAWIEDVSRQNFGGSVTFAGGEGPELDAANAIVRDAAGQPVMTSLTSLERYRRTLYFQQQGLTTAEIRALGGGATQLSIAGGEPLAEVSQWDVAPFVQDEWRVSPQFTLSLGLRYENQTNVTSSWNLAPRVSFAWAPGKPKANTPAKTIVRGGFGIFYDRVSESLTLTADRFDGVSQRQYLVTDVDVLDEMQFYYDRVEGLPSVAALDAFRLPQALRRVSPDIETPVTYQSSLSLERALPGGFTFSANVVATQIRRMLRSRNVNAPLPDTGERPLGNDETVYQYESTGRLNQAQLMLGLNNRMSRSLSLFVRYFLGRAKSDTDGAGSFPADQYDTAAEYGPAGMDVRHRFTLGGNLRLPGDVRVSPFVIASSGRPYNITVGRDLNGDTVFTDRPAYATDSAEAGVVSTEYGLLDPNPEPGARIVPRNLGRGPAFVVFNLRLNKSFALRKRPAETTQPTDDGPRPGGPPPGMGGPGGGPGGRGGFGGGFGHGHGGEGGGSGPSLSISIGVQNLFNHVNAGTPVGNLGSPLFGQSTASAGGFGFGRGGASAAGNRRVDIRLRLGF